MIKKWQILDKYKEGEYAQLSDYNPMVLQLLNNRNLKEKENILEFLDADFKKYTYDPFLFKNMEAAVELAIKHIKAGNKITVYGDYDADGVTAAALVYEILTTLKAEVETYIPHRVTEGYGLNEDAVKEIAENGTKLIITVDSGIKSKNEVSLAKKLGMDVIITDHHVPPESKAELPECLIINPAVPEETYPYSYLSGVGVAYKFAKALIKKSKLDDCTKEKLEIRALDLVAIGTVADCVTLLGENRTLVKKGLEILTETKRIGLKELMEVAKIKAGLNLDSWNIGFQIAPRLNAAGRMDSATTAYELLITKDKNEAKVLAGRLNSRNYERQRITVEIMEKVELGIEKEDDGKTVKENIIVAVFEPQNGEKAWNEGVIGLVAGRISNRYYRPVLVLTKTEEGFKGSGRSIPGFNIVRAVEECSEFLEKYGGHPAACGLSLREENLIKFKKKIKEVADRELKNTDLKPSVLVENELVLKDINEELWSDIIRFEPFGQDNARPIFASYGLKVLDIFYMGLENQHIKLRLKNPGSAVFSALGFSQAEKWQDVKIGDMIDLAYTLDINEYNGRREIQMKIVDIKIK